MRRLIVTGGVVIAGAAVLWLLASGEPSSDPLPIPGEGPHPIRVEVLNGTGVDGLARRTTRHLRLRGIDVVYFGTAASDTFAATVLLARRGDSSATFRVRDALGTGLVRVEPDPSLLLDVSVIVGRDTPAALDLHP